MKYYNLPIYIYIYIYTNFTLFYYFILRWTQASLSSFSLPMFSHCFDQQLGSFKGCNNHAMQHLFLEQEGRYGKPAVWHIIWRSHELISTCSSFAILSQFVTFRQFETHFECETKVLCKPIALSDPKDVQHLSVVILEAFLHAVPGCSAWCCGKSDARCGLRGTK